MAGLCCVPGLDKYQDAYRGELGGLYGITLAIWALEQYYPTDQYSLDIYCDGQEAQRKAGRALDDCWGLYAQQDLLGAIWSLRANLRSTLSFWHVDGHQDAHKAPEALTVPELLNVKMDFWAKHVRLSFPPRPVLLIFRQHWTVSVDNQSVSSCHQAELREHCASADLLTWWQQRDYITPYNNFQHIDWDALSKAMSSLSLNRRLWLSKHVSGRCPLGVEMVRRKQRDSPACPRCGVPETAPHVWACQHHSANVSY